MALTQARVSHAPMSVDLLVEPCCGGTDVKPSRFIQSHVDAILGEWETFARSLTLPGSTVPVSVLQDHAMQMLTAIARNMDTSKTEQGWSGI